MNNSYGSVENGDSADTQQLLEDQPKGRKSWNNTSAFGESKVKVVLAGYNKNLAAIVSVILVTAVLIGVGVGLANNNQSGAATTPESFVVTPEVPDESATTKDGLVGNASPAPLHGGRGTAPSGTYSKAAVATDGKPCATVGVNVLKRNGTAVDAAIATLFCNGVYTSQSMGIGGGFVMTIYSASTGEATTLTARETAPAAATEDMFHGNPELSKKGPLAIAVPGQVRGYYEAKLRFGNPDVSWASLVQPAIDLARNGITVSWSAAKALRNNRQYIHAEPAMSEVFLNPETGDVWKTGDVYTRPTFAKTLEAIAAGGDKAYYEGEVAEKIVKDLKELGSIITMEDLKNYRALWQPSVNASLHCGGDDSRAQEGLELHSTPLPSSGIILAYIMNLMKWFKVDKTDDNPLLYHRMNEAFKWAYAHRSKLGDPSDPEYAAEIEKEVSTMLDFNTTLHAYRRINDNKTYNDPKFYGGEFEQPDDAGTSNTCVLAPNGDAVAVTSTVNTEFGCGLMSPSTGIIFNDQMDDFSSPNITNFFKLPPSPTNFIKPGKRPLSSMTPAVFVQNDVDANNNQRNNKKVKLIVGSAGGTKITTAVAQVSMRNLWLDQELQFSIEACRIHHQLLPMSAQLQKCVPKEVVDKLRAVGNEIEFYNGPGSIVTAIRVGRDGKVYATSDPMKAGGVDGF